MMTALSKMLFTHLKMGQKDGCHRNIKCRGLRYSTVAADEMVYSSRRRMIV